MRVARLAHVLIALLIGSASVAPSANAQDLAGEWRGSVTCNGLYNEVSPWPLKITLSPTGVSTYALHASFLNASATGTVDGSEVSWSGGSFFNTLTATGNVNNHHMSGQYSQSMGSTCIWSASKVIGNEFALTITPAERQKDRMGVDCEVRKQMLAAELGEATEKMSELSRLPANCEFARTNLARSVNGYGKSIVTMSRYHSTCSSIEAAEFREQGERFYTSGWEIMASCTQ
jgi:hypothetical protein